MESNYRKKLTILAFLVTEVLGNGQTSQGNTGTGSGGLVHLTEDQSDLGLAIKLNDGGLLHFVVQIVTLTSTLADTSEDRVTTVGLGDVVDQLLNEDGLADTGTTEETNLSTTSVGSEQIDDLDTSDQNLGRGGLISERRGVGVNGQELVGLDRSSLVNGVTSDVQDTTKSGRADGDGNGSTSVRGLGATDETLGTCRIDEYFRSYLNDDNQGFLPSIAMQRTTFSPKCC
jgi:hypothetical protein